MKQTIPSCCKHSYKMHRDSHTISKLKPKIRIIHIIAPEIIKTDVENFRELVQRLTGKHAARDQVKGKKERRKKIESSSPQQEDQHRLMMNMLQQENTTRIMKEEESSSHEEGIYGSSSNGSLSGFGSMEGFIQDLGDQYPLFPNFKPTQINMFGEMPLC